ncbi:IgaA/UmoB family intracellular growth attenuator [Zophobihabitans entericus]|uniref:Intracellular growth attenuator family protein n=1 Tax=Zophobihabitans entericus TaxID=1635327 RepID=A0A6G9ICM2_9GAMM|nr:IgaA/UmoB family intracellular growth attenuator [Zophobihabitans entericus]QIQ21587.1 intracellular growth attenuator family protein [Zophobihabitans entericus]
MDGIALILKLILLGIFLISAISYAIQRSGNKANLKAALSSEPLRELTTKELELLNPYLVDKKLVKPPYKHQEHLANLNVFLLSGPCIAHTITTNNSSSTYYTIADVEVFFPYEMDKYTIDFNQAEVAFTGRYAFVVNLNGVSLEVAKNVQDDIAKDEADWQAGVTLTAETRSYKDYTGSDESPETEDEPAYKETVQIISQRDLTETEKKMHSQANTGFVSSVFLVIAAIIILFIINHVMDIEPLVLCVIAVICLGLAAFFYIKKAKREEEKVNHVRGTVGFKSPENKTLYIGNAIGAIYPQHWDQDIPATEGSTIDVDVTVTSKNMLRFGHTHSVEDEIKRFGAPRFWGRNCFLFIVCAILSIIFYISVPALKGSMIYMYAKLTGSSSEVITVTDKEGFNKEAFTVGSWVNLRGQGQCARDAYYCERILVSRDIPYDVAPEKLILPSWARKLANDQLYSSVSDAQVTSMQSMMNMLSGYNSYNVYGSSSRQIYLTKLKSLDAVVAMINDICFKDKTTPGMIQGSCDNLAGMVVNLYNDDLLSKSDNFYTWELLVEDEEEGMLPSDVIVTTSSTYGLESRLISLANTYLRTDLLSLENIVDKYQRENMMVLDVTFDPTNNSVSFPRSRLAGSDRSMSATASYSYLVNVIKGKADEYFNVKGMVTGVSYNSDGQLVKLEVNADINPYTDSLSVLLTAIGFIFLIALTVWQLLTWIYKIMFNAKRNRALSQGNNNFSSGSQMVK